MVTLTLSHKKTYTVTVKSIERLVVKLLVKIKNSLLSHRLRL